MTMLFGLVAALVFGGLLFVYFKKQVKSAEKRTSLAKHIVTCPHCTVSMNASATWQKTGMRGDILRCPKCGETSAWDFGIEPPRCKTKAKRRRDRK